MSNPTATLHLPPPCFAAALAILSASAMAAEHVWTGGDQGGYGPGSFAVDANWDGGAPVYAGRNPVIITQDTAAVSFTSPSVQNFYYGPWLIGGADSPHVNFTVTSGRPANNPAILTMGTDNTAVEILGSNTVVNVEAGGAISFSGISLTIDPLSTITGEGRLYFNRNVPGRDYGAMPIYLSGQTSLDGNVETTGEAVNMSGGSAGVNYVSTLSMHGFSLSAASLTMGTLDNHGDVAGNQSGFARIVLDSGSLDIDDGIVFTCDPDGTTRAGAPLTEDSSISGSGDISFGGDFTITTKSPGLWDIAGLALTADGDGSEWQNVEVLSYDRGDNVLNSSANYMMDSFTVKPGAKVRLVDGYDNNRADSSPEAMYVNTLTVEQGATLDLAGLKIYAKNVAMEGTLVENGGEIVLRTKPDLVTSVLLDRSLASSEHAMAVGPIVAADIDGDGKLEILAVTMDEDADADTFFYCIDYANGALSYRTTGNWPAAAPSIMSWMGIVDRGNGEEVFFKHSGWDGTWGSVRKLSADGSHTRLFNAFNGMPYAHRPIFADIDGDGTVEMVGARREGNRDNPNIYIVDASDFTVKSSFGVPERRTDNNTGILNAFGIGDYDGDGILEFSIGANEYGSNAVYRANGTKITEFVSDTPFGMTENFTLSKICDFDGDGSPEVFFLDGVNNYLRIYNADGTLRHLLNGNRSINYGFADFDGDGLRELVYGPKIYDGDGSVIATLPGYFAWNSGIALADFNGDQVPEVVYITAAQQNSDKGRYINIYDVVAGALLEGCPIRVADGHAEGTETAGEEGGYLGAFHHWRATQPIVADLDDNGTWEIIVGNGEQRGGLLFYPAISVINYPIHYRLPLTRSARQLGWRTADRDMAYSCEYPFPVSEGTILLLK